MQIVTCVIKRFGLTALFLLVKIFDALLKVLWTTVLVLKALLAYLAFPGKFDAIGDLFYGLSVKG